MIWLCVLLQHHPSHSSIPSHQTVIQRIPKLLMVDTNRIQKCRGPTDEGKRINFWFLFNRRNRRWSWSSVVWTVIIWFSPWKPRSINSSWNLYLNLHQHHHWNKFKCSWIHLPLTLYIINTSHHFQKMITQKSQKTLWHHHHQHQHQHHHHDYYYFYFYFFYYYYFYYYYYQLKRSCSPSALERSKGPVVHLQIPWHTSRKVALLRQSKQTKKIYNFYNLTDN